MIESTVLATGGCFLTLTVTISVDLAADQVVDPADPVDSVVDPKYPVDLCVDHYPNSVLRSVEAFLLFTISVLCDLCLGSTFYHCNFFASKHLDECNLCMCFSSGNLCFSEKYVLFEASMLWICGQLPCRLPCRSVTHLPCRFACRSTMCKPCRFACRSICRFDHSASTA